VDDHPVFRRGLRELLEATGRYEVISEAASGEDAIQAALDHRPALIILDLALPDLDGVIVLRRILARWPDARILMVTLHDDPHHSAQCLAAGALGYIGKHADVPDLVRAIDAVAAGQQILGAGLSVGSRPATHERFGGLTPREREVLTGLARGLTNTAIASELCLSPKTVRNLVSMVLAKTGSTNRVEAGLRYASQTRT
jgi:DNA-binding NarL/FixJ family response regulator